MAEGSQGGDRRRRLRVVSPCMRWGPQLCQSRQQSHPQSRRSETSWDHDRFRFQLMIHGALSQLILSMEGLHTGFSHPQLRHLLGPLHEIWRSFIQQLGTTRK